MRLTTLGKIVLLILAVGVAVGGWRLWGKSAGGLISRVAPSATEKPSVVPPKADLPSTGNPNSGGSSSGSVALTSAGGQPGCADRPEVRMLVWAWNAQMGLMLANGGPQATGGSLMCKRGVNLKLIRQDDTGKMQEALAAFATELSRGVAQPTKGAHFVNIMGDGSATFLK